MNGRHVVLAGVGLALVVTAGAGPAAARPVRASSALAAVTPPASRHVGVWAAPRPRQNRAQALTDLETGMTAHAPVVSEYLAWDQPFPDRLSALAAGHGSAMLMLIKLKRLDGSRPLWADLALATPGTPLYADLDRWAAAVKGYPGLVYVGFHKEPNEPANVANGTAADFRHAYQVFVRHLRAAGVTNARYVWTLPVTQFVGSPAPAASWYPGDAVVDVIGATGANRFGCALTGSKTWRSFEQLFGAAHAWAHLHPGRTFGVVEAGTVEDPAVPDRKAAWLDDAHALAATPAWSDLELTVYFSSGASDNGGFCPWWLDTSPSALAAAGRWMTDPAFGALP